MKQFSYEEQFERAINSAFATSNAAVRLAYLDLAKFYQEKIDEQLEASRAERALQLLQRRRARQSDGRGRHSG